MFMCGVWENMHVCYDWVCVMYVCVDWCCVYVVCVDCVYVFVQCCLVSV